MPPAFFPDLVTRLLFLLGHVFLAVPVVDLITCGQPYVIMLGDVFKRPFKVLELVRLANVEGVQTNWHATCVGGAFFVQHIFFRQSLVATALDRVQH